ncbi:MAG: methyltransferase family protein, partial [Promethearchaeota archaeon]
KIKFWLLHFVRNSFYLLISENGVRSLIGEKIISNKKSGAEREHPHSHQLHISCAVAVIVMMLLDTLVFKISNRILGFIPWYIRVILCGSILAIALFLIYKSHEVLFSEEEEGPSTLVTEGIFAHTRNPMYLGILLIHLSFILLTISLLALAAWIVVIVIYNRMVAFEDKILEEMFGDKFRAYKKKVHKWI